ncbi:MAG TPA: three-Cys-motif partner protein TcmP [Syntrophales bacterium]|nr:three-Cys-motif partner protein TcmP [Syntrophales bacterium]
MVKDFFKNKREWSEYKDLILSYYLTPYLPKVCSLGRSVVVIDCFAGPGRFEDGKDGSPLIIAKAVSVLARKNKSVSARFIEERKKYYRKLEANILEFNDFCEAKPGTFESSVAEIGRLAKNNTVFVYIDPYGIKSLKFSLLASIYRYIQQGSSVEVLLNFNSPSFVRNGLASLKVESLKKMEYDMNDEELSDIDRTMQPEDIDEIAGGDYWRAIVRADLSFQEKEKMCVNKYMEEMARYFNGVCSYPIKEKYSHAVPKYRLIFGSRHPDALILMNDAVCTARDDFLMTEVVDGFLFDLRKDDERHDPLRLKSAIMDTARQIGTVERKDLIVKTLEMVFGEYKISEHKKKISEMLKEGTLFSLSGKSRINDRELLSTKPL